MNRRALLMGMAGVAVARTLPPATTCNVDPSAVLSDPVREFLAYPLRTAKYDCNFYADQVLAFWDQHTIFPDTMHYYGTEEEFNAMAKKVLRA
jgi:hypothetical protein